MTTTAEAEAIVRALGGHRCGAGWMARCPAHDDRTPSLSISDRDGRVLVHCHAGCDQERVIHALRSRGLWPDAEPTRERRIVATYDYRDEHGELLYQVVRFEPKGFAQRRPDGRGGWVWSLGDVRRVLYRLPELIHEETQWVIVAEGEKDVETLRTWDYVATTNAEGAGKWRDEYAHYFSGRHVLILPDADDPGRRHALRVAESVLPVARSVVILELPRSKDVTQWVEQGGTPEELKRLVGEAPRLDAAGLEELRRRWGCLSQPANAAIAPDGDAGDDHSETSAPTWPAPLAEEAFLGLAGEFVRLVEAHSEADPAALLVQFLVEFGSLVGRKAHFVVEADSHFTNLFVCLVGPTAKGRKGTSESQVRRILGAVDTTWATDRVMSGLASGEGLIWQVRDAIETREPTKDRGRITGYQTVIADEGVSDKRLLVVEPEFARVLQVCEREACTLSAIIRAAWDTGDLHVLTKKQAARATGAHISIVGHVTRDELVRLLSDTALANGFANRFLWVCVRRSKCLPRGGQFAGVDFAPLTRRLAAAVEFARECERVEPDEAAWSVWERVYPDLSEGRPGMLGSVTARAEAQTMRLAMLYALLESSTTIGVEHLEAALAVWRYCYDSARWVWGDAVGDPVADEILRALRGAGEPGMTRAEIYDHFGRHVRRERLGTALMALGRAGWARPTRRGTEGRPVEVWHAV